MNKVWTKDFWFWCKTLTTFQANTEKHVLHLQIIVFGIQCWIHSKMTKLSRTMIFLMMCNLLFSEGKISFSLHLQAWRFHIFSYYSKNWWYRCYAHRNSHAYNVSYNGPMYFVSIIKPCCTAKLHSCFINEETEALLSWVSQTHLTGSQGLWLPAGWCER